MKPAEFKFRPRLFLLHYEKSINQSLLPAMSKIVGQTGHSSLSEQPVQEKDNFEFWTRNLKSQREFNIVIILATLAATLVLFFGSNWQYGQDRFAAWATVSLLYNLVTACTKIQVEIHGLARLMKATHSTHQIDEIRKYIMHLEN